MKSHIASFCKKPHREVDGKPVGHACCIMLPAVLIEESRGIHRGIDPRVLPLKPHKGLKPEEEEAPITHGDLCKHGALWLQRNKRATVVVVDHQSTLTNEQPDALAWAHGGRTSYLIEAKVSRADFRKDAEKVFRRSGAGMGCYRYYLTPFKMVTEDEVPSTWGLLYFQKDRVSLRKEAAYTELTPTGRAEEKALLISLLSRASRGEPLKTLLPRPTEEKP